MTDKIEIPTNLDPEKEMARALNMVAGVSSKPEIPPEDEIPMDWEDLRDLYILALERIAKSESEVAQLRAEVERLRQELAAK